MTLTDNSASGMHHHGGEDDTDCAAIHLDERIGFSVIDDSLILSPAPPQTICINGEYYSDVMYVSVNGGGNGLTMDSPITLDNAFKHLYPGGKIVFSGETYILDDYLLENLANLIFVGNGTTTFKKDENNASSSGIFNIKNSNLTIENIIIDDDINFLDNSNVTIRDCLINTNLTVENDARLDLDSVAID